MVVTYDLSFQAHKLVLCELCSLLQAFTHPASLGAMLTSRLVLGHVSASHYQTTARIRALDTCIATLVEMSLGVLQLALPRAVINARSYISGRAAVATAVICVLIAENCSSRFQQWQPRVTVDLAFQDHVLHNEIENKVTDDTLSTYRACFGTLHGSL
jgi:hypothetical protein